MFRKFNQNTQKYLKNSLYVLSLCTENQEGLCWLAVTGNGSDQAHPCYLNPALPHLKWEVEWKPKPNKQEPIQDQKLVLILRML